MNSVLNFSGRRKTPLVLQTEAAECGLACLAMVAGGYGYRSDLATLRGKYSISLKGTTLAQLIKIAAQLNLNSRPLRLELELLPRLRLPAILHWDMSHFVVLTEIRRGKAVIFDPNVGRRVFTLDELSQHFTGVALELTPNDQFQTKTEINRITFRQLVGRLPGLSRTLGQLLALALVVEVLAIASPLFMQLVLDHAVVAGDQSLLTVLGLGFLLLTFIKVGVSALRSWVSLYLNTVLNLQMLSRLYAHLLRLPMHYFGRRHLGDIVSRFDSLGTIRRTMTSNFLDGLIDGMMALVTATMMFVYSWRLALIVIAATLLYAVLRATRYAPLRQATEDQIVCAARQESNFLEAVRGMQSVKLFNRQEQRAAVYQNMAVDTFNANIRIQRLRMIFSALNSALFGLENISVIWLGATFLLEGGFSVGMLFAFMSYKSQFTSRMTNLIDNAVDLKMLDLHRERVADIALTETERDERGASLAPLDIRADIEVRNLSVRYAETEPFVLQHINLRIEEGSSVAIVGPSGCGKTTLLKAMMGLLPVSEGEILIGGVDLARLSPGQYRNMIGAVMQEDQLFSGSLADNIAFFDPQPDFKRVESSAKLAAIHEDIMAMPMGYQSLVGDMGTTLSGGQKQRVLLARALYKQPKILLLDEATSHLDVPRERLVSEAIRQLKLTRVIIAHRQETIATADIVIRLNGEAEPVTPLSASSADEKLLPATKKETNACQVEQATLAPAAVVPPAAVAHEPQPIAQPQKVRLDDEWETVPAPAKLRRNAFAEALAQDVWLEMQPLPAGNFMMGSPSGYGRVDEQPLHHVTLGEFYLSCYPITQAQWRAVMGDNPSQIRGDLLPVDSVAWDEAMSFCQRLSLATGRRYRLPTEGEWEYACRAGADARFDSQFTERQLAEQAWFLSNAWLQPKSVGLKSPNAWGFYDMLGNVWEWCQDGYDPTYYHRSPLLNPTGLANSDTFVVRGGSWFDGFAECRPAARRHHVPELRCSTVGFRVVCEG